VQAVDLMKPTISRAMATFTTLAVLPRARGRRYRARGAEPNLRFPPNVANDFWQRLDPVDLVTADALLHPISPGTFDQRAANMCIAGLGDARAPGGLSARPFTWDQAEIAMSWRGFEKRVKSATSATGTAALISAILRIACMETFLECQVHYAFKTLAFTMINLRHFCQG
jgi:hypothetical protein